MSEGSLEGIFWECIKGHRFNEGRIEGVSDIDEIFW